MVITYKDYYVANDEIASDADIEECIRIAKEEKCRIRLFWSGPGWKWYPSERNAYVLYIDENSTLENCKKLMPKVYGV